MQVWTAAVSNRSEAAKIGADEFRRVNEAAIAACDTIDGVADGVIETPRACGFDPTVLVCANGGDACLAPEQGETFSLVYRGPVRRSGEPIFPGLERGSELGWATLSAGEPLSLARETYELLVYGETDWQWRDFNADTDFAAAVERIGPLMDSNDADLGEFVERGGRLLLYHGWNDPGIPPGGTIRYYDEVRATLVDSAGDDSVRLFMVPGMNHCGGGTGTDQFDAVAALDRWVASGTPPASLPAERRANGETVRTRPLCPYPSVATYNGSGSTDNASNFSCR
jgi:feruloyl esterase